MGAVYQVLDTSSQRRLALKQLDSAAVRTSGALFQREYQTLAGLRHPNIVEVYEYGSDVNGPYYTMELVEGQELGHVAPLDVKTTCRYLHEAASILGLLHAHKLVHRDLSPRNLLRTQSGRLKLIDFGALAAFGPATEIVVTPPFIAPELLRGQPLDQRSDLFALGALGYWLLTGAHAYPARTISDLATLWERKPVAPSRVLALVSAEKAAAVPAALDALLLSLLRVDREQRPETTAELIDCLSGLAEFEPEDRDEFARGYLESKVFVGREHEHERIRALLAEVEAGTGHSVLVTGSSGSGRSRLLQEAAVEARMSGALTIMLDARHRERAFGTAHALAFALIDAQPELALAASRPFASELALGTPALRERLGIKRISLTSARDEGIRLQNALRNWVLTIAGERTVTILLDDFGAIDADSQGMFASLAHAAREYKLFLLVSALHEPGSAPDPAQQSIRQVATHLPLSPLSSAQTHELVRSIFGGARYLQRCAERLHRASGGNPAYCIELAEHLVHSGLARYDAGSWTLPAELHPGSLPSSRAQALLERVARLSEPARSLARALSVPHHGALTEALAEAASQLPREQARAALAELVSMGLIIEVVAGYRFVHEGVRKALDDELSPEQRAGLHRRFGRAMVAAGGEEHFDQLSAALHLARGELAAEAPALMRPFSRQLVTGELSQLRTCAPLLEELLPLLMRQGDEYVLSIPLLSLGLAGYFVDRRYERAYGERAIALFSKLLRIPLARRLSPLLGRRLALFVALVVAGVALHRRRSVALSLTETVRAILAVASALTGTALVCVDPDRARRYADSIEPLSALGSDHAAGLIYAFARSLEMRAREHTARSSADSREQIRRLESGRPIRNMPEDSRLQYLAGMYFGWSIPEAWRDDPEVLRLADRLESFGPLYAMSADHVRASYYASQGDLVRARHHRSLVELHAVQLGSTWQAET
ncbi:MAG: serine/threonine protein kinase, partial [Myxococcaceae bacterium]|nr:serine/threonine protein kinase [Myxococcaceae bacterium]